MHTGSQLSQIFTPKHVADNTMENGSCKIWACTGSPENLNGRIRQAINTDYNLNHIILNRLVSGHTICMQFDEWVKYETKLSIAETVSILYRMDRGSREYQQQCWVLHQWWLQRADCHGSMQQVEMTSPQQSVCHHTTPAFHIRLCFHTVTSPMHSSLPCLYSTHTHTHTWIMSGTTRLSRHQKDKTRKVKPIWIYWCKR